MLIPSFRCQVVRVFIIAVIPATIASFISKIKESCLIIQKITLLSLSVSYEGCPGQGWLRAFYCLRLRLTMPDTNPLGIPLLSIIKRLDKPKVYFI